MESEIVTSMGKGNFFIDPQLHNLATVYPRAQWSHVRPLASCIPTSLQVTLASLLQG